MLVHVWYSFAMWSLWIPNGCIISIACVVQFPYFIEQRYGFYLHGLDCCCYIIHICTLKLINWIYKSPLLLYLLFSLLFVWWSTHILVLKTQSPTLCRHWFSWVLYVDVSNGLINNKSVLVQIMVGTDKAIDYYLNQIWPTLLTHMR